jgi:deazaflavin-dependent oxidoreductase (nitroreductase family)
MSIQTHLLALANKGLEGTHRALLAVTGGRFPQRLAGMQCLELHAIGRKTGQMRSTMLSTPLEEDGRIILVASKGGYPEDPIWYKNLVANPEVEITIRGTTTPMLARTASPEERAELWPRIVERASNYAGYQKRAPREIPVVICEPRPDGG